MTQTSTVYKSDEVGRGGFPLSLCEYVSRESRLDIVKVIVDAIHQELEIYKENGQRRISVSYNQSRSLRCRASSLLANYLGVTKRTVNHWLAKRHQSCNINMEKLLDVAFRYSPEKTIQILEQDLENHQLAIDLIRYKAYDIPKVGRGGFSLKQRVVA